jgi:hypothetical protein
VVFDGGEVAGVAMHAPPHNLFLPRLKSGTAAQIADALVRSKRTLPGVTGEVATVDEFVRNWSRQTGIESRLNYAMRMYRLDAVVPPRSCKGRSAGPVSTTRRY